MDAILDFLADNYKWFMIGAGALLIALVGFIVDGKKKKNKGEELPESTTTLNQATAANQMTADTALPQAENATAPSQTTEPSLVFEQPSLNNNETMNEINGNEPSLTFENESAPVDFSNPNLGGGQSVEVGTIGEPIEAPVPGEISSVETSTPAPAVDVPQTVGVPVEAPVVEISPAVEAPATPVVEAPVAQAPVVETPAVEMPTPEVAPTVETPEVQIVPPVEVVEETPVVMTPEAPATPTVQEPPVEQAPATPVAQEPTDVPPIV